VPLARCSPATRHAGPIGFFGLPPALALRFSAVLRARVCSVSSLLLSLSLIVSFLFSEAFSAATNFRPWCLPTL
jgi:hypothetical protein